MLTILYNALSILLALLSLVGLVTLTHLAGKLAGHFKNKDKPPRAEVSE